MARGLGDALEAAVVDRVGDEAADVGMHPARAAKEDTEVGRNGGVAIEQVLEAGEAGVAGVAALDGLGELHLVADEDQVPGRLADGDRVGERDLAGLVHEQVVEPAGEIGAAW